MLEKLTIEISSLDALTIAGLLEFLRNSHDKGEILLASPHLQSIENYSNTLVKHVTADHLEGAHLQHEINNLLTPPGS